jgi:hypothetical protein
MQVNKEEEEEEDIELGFSGRRGLRRQIPRLDFSIASRLDDRNNGQPLGHSVRCVRSDSGGAAWSKEWFVPTMRSVPAVQAAQPRRARGMIRFENAGKV